MQTFFNTLFDIENIANFYAIGSSFFLTYHHSKKYKNLTIKDSISQPLDKLVPIEKKKIKKHIKFRKLY